MASSSIPSTPVVRSRRPSVPASLYDALVGDGEESKVPLPSAFHPPPNVTATPLPWVSLTVLSITVMGEFLCANVSTPFLLFMVRGFGVGEDEAEVASWTGILVSVFFLTQFVTSLLWASLADKFGLRNVLLVSLLGSSITCTIFGTLKTFQSAVGVRLIQGIFAGAIGVARSGVAAITDSSNEGRAYAIMGFAWGLGGVIGAVIGGTFESPAQKWPHVFARFEFLKMHPYLLPCAMAASVTLAGAAMCMFLDRDGRQRQLDVQSDTDTENFSPLTLSPQLLSPQKGSGVPLPSRVETLSNENSGARPFGVPLPSRVETLSNESGQPRRYGIPLGRRVDSFASARSQRPIVAFAPEPVIPGSSPMGFGAGHRRSSAASRSGQLRMTLGTPSIPTRLWTHRRSSVATEASEMNFAERLIAANENQVTSMAQLWVDAAIRTDVPVSEQVGESALDFESDDDVEALEPHRSTASPRYRPPSIPASEHTPLLFRPGTGTPQRPQLVRRSSSASILYPAIFTNPGVEAPPHDEEAFTAPVMLPGGIEAIQEERNSMISSDPDADLESVLTEVPPSPQQPSVFKQIPTLVVVQYGLLALHTTTHDQVFYSYLMSRFESGGLGLTAVHFSQIIAIMSVVQVVYQFYLYAYIGPPRGSLSHLSMFRLGSLLFIPSYITVTLYRGWEPEVVMPGLIASTAVRYCATTFAFTSITILLNYRTSNISVRNRDVLTFFAVTPPSAVGLANGLAQSMASLARFIGPALGAKVWELSVKTDPSGYPLGFWVCSAVCAGALVSSFMIR
ncbi:major facilitator superfamily domain-containing protein [Auriculariales sp. MPI-PUGE-AT-0066]|nr:major facilitator superfamily domain-containing protein [Auriculariales sp. MPI-PUGE-AT-0066]